MRQGVKRLSHFSDIPISSGVMNWDCLFGTL
jgi:hypothetical protein